ncbi:uncharacterized protein LOC135350128 [Halichondria panicea]|uniref:uncharacterized protein LOC135350128 n=1 Tax=Halichondria panicea TaxID=6063 RepID=UPI00312B3D9C
MWDDCFNLLLGELSSVSGCGDRVFSLLPLCAETLQHRHYPQHINLLETLLKLETWRVVTQTRGVQLVEQHIHKVVNKECLKSYERRLFHCPVWRAEWCEWMW